MAKSQLRLLCVVLFLLFPVLVPPGTAVAEEKPSPTLSTLPAKTSTTNSLVDLSSKEKEWLAQHKTTNPLKPGPTTKSNIDCCCRMGK